jgi:myo-inositol-1(or 4)-monophosphatase
MPASQAAHDADWLEVCRRAAARVLAALEPYPETSDRAATTGRGEGGDETLVIDRAAEDAVIEELRETGLDLTVISEERGRVELEGGGATHVVVDPIDGSLNAKRNFPGHCLSIAVAGGDAMSDVHFGYVRELSGAVTEWWAAAGEGAHRDGTRLRRLDPEASLEVLAVEGANPKVVAPAAEALAATGARRLRIPGAIAISMCLVAGGQADAMIALAPARSVDFAAAQLIVSEAGGAVAFLDAGEDPSLDLAMRSRVAAAAGPGLLERVVGTVSAPA